MFGEGIQNDRIQAILEADVIPKLVCLLRPSKSRTVPISVQSAALQVLGNVACGDDRQTQVVIDSDALPCLRALLSSSDRGIRKEVCWIVSNITESSHQVQDVLDADILPPLLKLLENQDTACREDATWVLFNLSSNRDPNQIAYLAENNGIRALCNLLACPKDLDVLWKGCGTVAAVALKGLRNVLICGHSISSSNQTNFNRMALLVAEAHGVERIEALMSHDSPDVRNRARMILERIFGMEPLNENKNLNLSMPSVSCPQNRSYSATPVPQSGCSCTPHQERNSSETGSQVKSSTLYDNNTIAQTNEMRSSQCTLSTNEISSRNSKLPRNSDLNGSTSGSSTDSDPEDDDSDSDLIPPPPPPCSCLLCTDMSPLQERRTRGRGLSLDENYNHNSESQNLDFHQICDFCSGGGRLSDGRSGLAAKLGRAVRLGHSHCLAVLLSRMTWSQRVAAIEAPALLHPGGGPPDGGIGNSLPAIVLAAQLGKPICLSLLLRKCRPDLDVTYGKKRLTPLAWAAHKGYFRCCHILIEHGANAGIKCGDGGVTALHLAASGSGHDGICELLVENNAPVNARSFKRQTPLCLAAQKGSSRVVQLLLEHGADVNNEDDGKYTPLHLAASKGFEHCVDLLLTAHARVDALTRKGVTPLHYAVQGGHADIVRLLIAAGAQVNCTHKPLLLIAADDGNVEVVHMLLEAKATIDCKANIRAMLDKETEVSDVLTPLQLAASKAHQEVVTLLLSRGANVNEITTKRGWSALDFAVLNGHAECAVTLLKHGATVTDNCKSIGRNNWTLVQYAAHHGAKNVVRLLIQRLKEQRMRSVSCLASKESGIVGQASTQRGSYGLLSTHDSAESVNSTLKGELPVDETAIDTDVISSPSVESLIENIAGADDGSEQLYENCPTHDDCSKVKANHRYDPRSLDGDEVGFGTGPGYGSGSNFDTFQTVPPKSRRRVNKEDRQVSTRTRELRKRESEAAEARERLEEAMNQRSVSKLTEAIAHVSKLVLHLATNAAPESNVDGRQDYSESEELELHGNNSSRFNYCHNGLSSSGNGTCLDGNVTGSSGMAPTGSSPCKSGSSSLVMEVGLGNEVQKARKILAGLLAEEKRVREEKEKVVADSKRENAQIMVQKATKAVKDGRDPRSLTRAIARATRNVLDKNEEIIQQANAVVGLVTKLEKEYVTIRKAIREHDLDVLCDILPKATTSLSVLKKKGGEGAAQRVFGGGDPNKVLTEGDKLRKELQEKRDHAIQEEKRAKDLERTAKRNLESVMKSNDIMALELATKEASNALLAKDSELGTTIEMAKKTLTKWVKGERRKLKQARNSNDPKTIEETATAAAKLGLQSLQADIDGARRHAQILREQAEALKVLSEAISNSDFTLLHDIRSRLTKLGMFADAEKARAEVEQLQRAKRARSLLEDSIETAKQCRDDINHILSSSINRLKSGNLKLEMVANQSMTTNCANKNVLSSELLSLRWPEAQRLYELSERARRHEQTCNGNSLCATADRLVKELANLGRKILSVCQQSDDAQLIAAMIARYEKSFMSVSNPEVFDKPASDFAVENAKERLAIVQAMDQERVKAESAQVKVEYTIATSRRAMTVKNRGSKTTSIPSENGLDKAHRDFVGTQSKEDGNHRQKYGQGDIASNTNQTISNVSNINNNGVSGANVQDVCHCEHASVSGISDPVVHRSSKLPAADGQNNAEFSLISHQQIKSKILGNHSSQAVGNTNVRENVGCYSHPSMSVFEEELTENESCALLQRKQLKMNRVQDIGPVLLSAKTRNELNQPKTNQMSTYQEINSLNDNVSISNSPLHDSKIIDYTSTKGYTFMGNDSNGKLSNVYQPSSHSSVDSFISNRFNVRSTNELKDIEPSSQHLNQAIIRTGMSNSNNTDSRPANLASGNLQSLESQRLINTAIDNRDIRHAHGFDSFDIIPRTKQTSAKVVSINSNSKTPSSDFNVYKFYPTSNLGGQSFANSTAGMLYGRDESQGVPFAANPSSGLLDETVSNKHIARFPESQPESKYNMEFNVNSVGELDRLSNLNERTLAISSVPSEKLDCSERILETTMSSIPLPDKCRSLNRVPSTINASPIAPAASHGMDPNAKNLNFSRSTNSAETCIETKIEFEDDNTKRIYIELDQAKRNSCSRGSIKLNSNQVSGSQSVRSTSTVLPGTSSRLHLTNNLNPSILTFESPVQINCTNTVLSDATKHSSNHQFRTLLGDHHSDMNRPNSQTRESVSNSKSPHIELGQSGCYHLHQYYHSQTQQAQHEPPISSEMMTAKEISSLGNSFVLNYGQTGEEDVMTEIIGVNSSAAAAAAAAAANEVRFSVPHSTAAEMEDLKSLNVVDLDLEFENQNFGFDINTIVNDTSTPLPISEVDHFSNLPPTVDVELGTISNYGETHLMTQASKTFDTSMTRKSHDGM